MLRHTVPCGRSAAFTLVELLVVIAVIGVLAGLSLPIYSTVMKTANKTTCISHLKQIVAATNLATNDNNGLYPNLHGYSWEQGSTWISDGLAPYISGVVNQDPTKLLRCPAAEKNAQEPWLEASQYCHYRYNIWHAQSMKPAIGYVNAMLYFDTTYSNWTSTQIAHSGTGGNAVNVAYADGHVVSLPYSNFVALDPSDDSQNDFFTLGWTK